MTEDQKEKFAQEKQRLLQNNSLILATVNTEGHPLASSTPFVTKGENFYIFISNKLSPHTQNLLGCSTANILLVEDESLCRNNFARARMNLNVDAQTVSRDSEEFLEIIDLMQEKHGSRACTLFCVSYLRHRWPRKRSSKCIVNQFMANLQF